MKTFTLILLGLGNMNNYTINTRIGPFFEFTTSNTLRGSLTLTDKQKPQEVIIMFFWGLVFIGGIK